MQNAVAIYILIAIFLLWKLDFIASLLNIKALNPKLPKEFSDVFDQQKYEESQAYTRAREKFGLIQGVFSTFLLIAFWQVGGFGWFDTWVREFGWNETLTGIAFIIGLTAAQSMFSLPFEIYSTFVIEEKFGFNKTTVATFIVDQLKGLLLMGLIGIPILALILWIFSLSSIAWLYAWIAFTSIQLLLTYLAPTYIMPLFNKFEPMPEGELKEAINAMAKKVDFPLTELFVMDGSKRSTKSNAFFTGFGKNKKIALFDTLIENHTTEELVGVLAHEIGHFKCKHIIKRLISGIVKTSAIFFLLGLVTNPNNAFAQMLFEAFGVEHISVYAGLIFFGILFSPVSRVLGVFSNLSSRKHEFEADAYAAKAQETPDHLIAALKKLSKSNLSNLTPHPLPVFLDYSHPPVLTRLEALQKLR